jgi:hypothetical protein
LSVTQKKVLRRRNFIEDIGLGLGPCLLLSDQFMLKLETLRSAKNMSAISDNHHAKVLYIIIILLNKIKKTPCHLLMHKRKFDNVRV